jgi:signal transduction histidine kinase
MSVTVDHQPLPAEEMGLKTIGQVLAHIQKERRLVVHVLLDGEEPDLEKLSQLKAAPLLGHTLFIETTEPKKMALEVLEQVREQLAEADRLTNDAVELLRDNQNIKAMEKLRGCFSTWQHAQESVLKVAQLLRIDLAKILVDGRPFTQVLGDFVQQLKLIKTALENRDFVSLVDTLVYEVSESSANWRAAIRSMASVIGG